MVGLITKDLLALKSYGKSILFVIIIYCIIGFFMGNVSFYNTMIIFITAMASINLFSYDNYYKWDRYAISMPLSRNKIVMAKYISAYSILLCGFMYCIIIDFINSFVSKDGMSLASYFSLDFFYFILCSVYISIVIPVIYKMGVEKGRIFIIALFVVPFVIIMILANKENTREIFEVVFSVIEKAFSENSFITILVIFGVLVSSIVFNIISYFISCNIFSKKEF